MHENLSNLKGWEPPLEINLKGHLALVTGASGQLGRVMARTLAACGADVVVHYHHSESAAQSVLRDVLAKDVQGMIVTADVTSQTSIQTMAHTVVETMGSPDIVVANAVIQIDPWQSVLEESPADYLSQFESCVMQSVYLAKAFIPAMMDKGYGRMIAINTECAIESAADSSAYVAGKRGLDGIVRTLAKEVGAYGITVNQIAPGWTLSERSHEFPEDDSAYIRTVPLGRRGTDQEIANVVAFMASDLSSFITGAYIPASGGRVIPAI